MENLEKIFEENYKVFKGQNAFQDPDDCWYHIMSEGEPSYGYTLLKNEKYAYEFYNKKLEKGIPTIIRKIPQ